MNISAKTKLCIIIGNPIEHSLSPKMHNAAYEALGIDNEYVFTASKVDVKDIETVVKAVRAMGIRGLTCTIPHKIEVIPFLDEVDEVAEKIGAVNTVVNNNGVLKGYNTDWIGTLTPLEQRTSLDGKKVALIGAGGAARAMAYAVTSKGAKLTVFNRTIEKAADLAQDFNAVVLPYSDIENVKDFDIILNATSLGMGSDQDKTPVQAEFLHQGHIVFDAVYSPKETRLLREAVEKGATPIYGFEMLLHQGTAQFELYTNQKAPVDVMKQILIENS